MNNISTIIATVLGIITIGFGGYYFYIQNNSAQPSFEVNEQTMRDMLRSAQAFIGYRAELDRANLDYGFFEDERLLSLQSFSTSVEAAPVGRPDPFAEVPGRESE